MEENVTRPREPWAYRTLNLAFAVLVILGIAYILWRGFASGEDRAVVPLFGEVTTLQWQGRQQSFRLVDYADPAALRPGDFVIREGEPGAIVWQVAAHDADRVRLRSGARDEAIPLPPSEGAIRWIRIAPAKP